MEINDNIYGLKWHKPLSIYVQSVLASFVDSSVPETQIFYAAILFGKQGKLTFLWRHQASNF